MVGSSPSSERRRTVRLRPIPDVPIEVLLLGAQGEGVALRVLDVSVGGLAVASTPALKHLLKDTRHRLRLKLRQNDPFEVVAEVRHRTGDEGAVIGLMIVEPTTAVISAVGKYVAELLERGALS